MESPWRTINLEYYSGTDNIKYIGQAVEINAPDNHPSFYISLLEYDSSNNIVKKIGPDIGQWSNRAGMF